MGDCFDLSQEISKKTIEFFFKFHAAINTYGA